MTKPVIYVLAIALTLLVLSQLGIGIAVSGLYSAIVVAIIWGLVSLTIKPLLGLLTLPITILTFGLFSFILNALLFWFVASFVEGFTVAGFIPALIGSAVISAVASVVHQVS